MRDRPWLSEEAIGFLEEILDKDSTVLEFGAGASTLWFAERCWLVVSYEHDRGWYEKILERIWNKGKNVSLIYDPDYPIRGIAKKWPDNCDLIMVDGRGRVNCIKSAWDRVKIGGWLGLDNSDRAKYREAIELLDGMGWEKKVIMGLIMPERQRNVTTFWRRTE